MYPKFVLRVKQTSLLIAMAEAATANATGRNECFIMLDGGRGVRLEGRGVREVVREVVRESGMVKEKGRWCFLCSDELCC